MTLEQKQFILDAIDRVGFSGTVGNAAAVEQLLELAKQCKAAIEAVQVDDG